MPQNHHLNGLKHHHWGSCPPLHWLGCYKWTSISFTLLQVLISHVILTYHVIPCDHFCDSIVLVTSIVLLCFTFISFTYL